MLTRHRVNDMTELYLMGRRLLEKRYLYSIRMLSKPNLNSQTSGIKLTNNMIDKNKTKVKYSKPIPYIETEEVNIKDK